MKLIVMFIERMCIFSSTRKAGNKGDIIHWDGQYSLVHTVQGGIIHYWILSRGTIYMYSLRHQSLKLYNVNLIYCSTCACIRLACRRSLIPRPHLPPRRKRVWWTWAESLGLHWGVSMHVPMRSQLCHSHMTSLPQECNCIIVAV
jgi:hypothetical protein